MIVLPITNIENWNKGYSSRYIYYKTNRNKPTHEEVMYFNHVIYHYFTQELEYLKEGIEIKFKPNDDVNDIYNTLTKNIKKYE